MKELMNKLNETGYYATIEDINKNGINKKGLVMRESEDDNVGVVFYDVTIKDYDSVIKDYKEHCVEKEKMQSSVVSAVQDIEHKAMLCIRPKRDDDVLTWDFLDLQLYVRIDVGDGTFIVTKNNMEHMNVLIEELFEFARTNSKNSMKVKGFGEMLFNEDVDSDDSSPKIMMCNDGHYGAIAMLFAEDVLSKDCYILPSSIHEVIALPVEAEIDVQNLKTMVYEINRAEVNEVDRLSDNVYLYRAKTQTVEVVE